MPETNRSSLLCLLLAAALLGGCASTPPAAGPSAGASEGYDLRIDGNTISLAFDRDLSMPEFLQLAQQVTNARYVYRQDQVAAAGPVSLVGRIQCERSAFPAFVDTMLQTHKLRAQVHGSGDSEYVEIAPIEKG